MRICFDLRVTQKSSRYTGIGIYTFELGRRLLKKYPDIFFLVRDKCELPFAIPEKNLIKVRSFDKPESFQEILDPLVVPLKLKRNGINIFHSPTPGYLNSISNIKIVTTVHDIIPDIFSDEKHKPFFNHLLYKRKNKNASKSDFVVFDSYCTQKDFINFYGEPKEYSVVYLGSTQTTESKITTSFNFQSFDKYIFYIGGFNKRKNFDYIFQLLPLINNNCRLNLVIGGNISETQKDRVKSLCQFYNIELNKIYFTGKLNSYELSNFYKFSYFFLYPSIYEGFGLPIAEALNEECLIFSTKTSSITEVGGKSIMYITGEHPEEDAQIINNTLQNPTLIEELKYKGRNQKKMFCWDKTTIELIKIYTRLYENTN